MEPRLKVESPKVYALIKRNLPEQEASDIFRLYEQAADRGANAEPHIVRKRVTSFNPRVARVLHILINLGAVRDSRTLSLALSENREPPSSPSSELVRLAFLLDDARHLHMSSHSQQQRIELFNKITNEVLPSIEFKQSARIKELLEAWAERFKIEYGS